MRTLRGSVWSMCRSWGTLGIVVCLSVLTLLELTGCAGVAQSIGEINLISTQEEVEMGARFAEEIEKDLELLDDPELTSYVNSVCQNLARHSKRRDIEYAVKIVRSDEINAFAVMGGFMYFNVGFLRASESESELAGVVGHEIGHIVGRHSAKHLSKQLGIAMIADLILGENPAMLESLVANVLAMGAMMHYSREAEREADAYAIEEMVGAGYDPEGLVTFFEKIRELEKRTPGAVERFFATHPPTEERLETARMRIAAIGDRSQLRSDSREFHQMMERLPAPPSEEAGQEEPD